MMDSAGALSVNQAMKSLFVARQYLVDDEIDLFAQPEFETLDPRDTASGGLNTLVRVTLEQRTAQRPREAKGMLVKAGPNSDPKVVAGAIAQNIRAGHHCAVSAQGAVSVYNAVRSIIFARRYLEPDGMDIEFQPQFPYSESNVMHMVLHPQ
jgi:stage V sporulation protein SpoVS|mmetsp:Transcript_87134/g.144913  ORF Transcript_87134/g.144913 Transcript_87134/m.144913 type:complete len:152 (-) Transcript_87134:1459-1914(-)